MAFFSAENRLFPALRAAIIKFFVEGGLTAAFPNCIMRGSWSEGGERLASFSVELFPGQKMDGCVVRVRKRAAGNRV
ncbi:MAG: hypothetical protein CEE38_08820 [Planctomycetes bacterium B3_Pla]|nr:MAG: hypothetical protein CEE38_08820 [Planctomycetes bacterium B3_Pla]